MIFRTRTIGVTGSLLVVVCLWSLPARAQLRPGPHERGGMAGDGAGIALPLLLRGANLTADQKSQVQQIMANHRATFRDLFGQLRAAQDQMANKLFSAGRLQEADLAPQVQQIAQLRKQLAHEGNSFLTSSTHRRSRNFSAGIVSSIFIGSLISYSSMFLTPSGEGMPGMPCGKART